MGIEGKTEEKKETETEIMKKVNITEKLINTIVIIFVLISVCSLSWIITCGIIQIIMMCIGLEYRWKVATLLYTVFVMQRLLFLLKSIIK